MKKLTSIRLEIESLKCMICGNNQAAWRQPVAVNEFIFYPVLCDACRQLEADEIISKL